MKKEVLFTSQVLDFLKTLTSEVKVKLRRAVNVLETEGMLHAPMAEKVEGQKGLYEIRVKDASGQYRVFYAYQDETSYIWLLNGFQKKTQKTPLAEIRKALRIKKELGL